MDFNEGGVYEVLLQFVGPSNFVLKSGNNDGHSSGRST
jgi:hypothetical protein